MGASAERAKPWALLVSRLGRGSNDQPRVRRKGHVSTCMKLLAKLGSQVPAEPEHSPYLSVKWRREGEAFGGAESEGVQPLE